MRSLTMLTLSQVNMIYIAQLVLYLFSKDYQFEFHKPQNYWKFIWSLILGPVKLVKVL
jgi:hypothetical protein